MVTCKLGICGFKDGWWLDAEQEKCRKLSTELSALLFVL